MCRAIAVLEKLASQWPTRPEHREDLAGSYANLADLLNRTGQRGEAEQAYRALIVLDQKLAADSPSAPCHRSSLAWSHKDMGDLLAKMGRSTEAEQAYRQAIVLFDKLVDESPSVPDYKNGSAMPRRLGSFLQATGRNVEAEENYRRAIALADDLTDPECQRGLSWALSTRVGNVGCTTPNWPSGLPKKPSNKRPEATPTGTRSARCA